MTFLNKRVLLVEDEPISHLIIQLTLESLNCQVDSAEDGKTAVQLAKTHHYDLILMDIGLPRLSGTEACLSIKKYENDNPHQKPTPIIAMTANPDRKPVEDYLATGISTVLYKPITKQHLINVLNQLA